MNIIVCFKQKSWCTVGIQKVRTYIANNSRAIPKNPTNCQEINDAFREENVMNALGRSKLPGNSIFFDGVVERETHSFCVFSSKFGIALVEKHIERARRHFYGRRNILCVPSWTIHATFDNLCSIHQMRK